MRIVVVETKNSDEEAEVEQLLEFVWNEQCLQRDICVVSDKRLIVRL